MNNLVTALILASACLISFTYVGAAPSCSSQPGVCWAIGDPHVRNFAGEVRLFSATGKVLMLSDRKSIWIRMEVKNTGRATQIVNVYIDFIHGGKRTHIVLNRETDNIYINYKLRPLPYSKWGVTIQPVKYGVTMDCDGIHIKWLNHARVFVTMAQKYQGLVDGECGPYCTKPTGPGYSSSKRNRATAALRLDKPFNENYANINSLEFGQLATEVENSIRTLYDPEWIDVKVVGAKPGSTVVQCNITLNEDDKLPAKDIQKDIATKLVSGKNKNGQSLGDLLHEKILDCEVSEPEVEFSTNDYDVEPEITASDEEDEFDEAIQESTFQGQGGPHFGNSANAADHHDHDEHFTHAPEDVDHHEEDDHEEHDHHDEHEATECVSKGVEYADGQTIEESYGTCTCNKGKWDCLNGFGICGLWGPDNIETFDEKHLKLDEECTYHLVDDCQKPPRFSVSSEERYECTENIKEKKRSVLLKIGSNNMRIGSKHIIYNGQHITPPQNITVGAASGVITVTEDKDKKKVKISLNSELVIEWDRKLYFGISINNPGARNNSCGLCGNFNDDPNDDLVNDEYKGRCRAEHKGCQEKDEGFEYPKQVYNVTCDDIEKVEFPIHGEVCKPIRDELLAQCEACVADIPNVCLHPGNLACIKQKEKVCVTDLFAHFLRTCYTTVFTAQAAGNGGARRKRRDVRAAQLREVVDSVDVDSMSINDINKVLKMRG